MLCAGLCVCPSGYVYVQRGFGSLCLGFTYLGLTQYSGQITERRGLQRLFQQRPSWTLPGLVSPNLWSRVTCPGTATAGRLRQEGSQGISFFLERLSLLMSAAKDPLHEEAWWALGSCCEPMTMIHVFWGDPSAPARCLAGAQSMFVE